MNAVVNNTSFRQIVAVITAMSWRFVVGGVRGRVRETPSAK